MIGITDVDIYIPPQYFDNLSEHERFQVDQDFISNKIGILKTARKSDREFASDLCVKAFQNLQARHQDIKEKIDCLVVCTQNGDFSIPHTSAIVHGKLDLNQHCAAFDISLGCSGYVYALHVMKSFMADNNLECGLLFTSDPYSPILDKDDKNTTLIFGDAATVTVLTNNPTYAIKKGVFESYGKGYEALIKKHDKPLFMNGREIFNFVMGNIPSLINNCLEKNELIAEQVDYYLLHQASKFLVDKLTDRLQCDSNKVPFTIQEYGNTVSSTIPILLKNYLTDPFANTLLLCGFGVGLSMAATVIRKQP
jgi:3-oxoacyl-[acyl-carrier-protein] synthase-3